MCMGCNLVVPDELHRSLRLLLGNSTSEFGMCRVCGEDIIHVKGDMFRCTCCRTDYYLKAKNNIYSSDRVSKERDIAETIKRNIQNIHKIDALETKIKLIEMRLSDDSIPQLKNTYKKYKAILDNDKKRWKLWDEKSRINTETAIKILNLHSGVCDVMRIKHPEYYDLYRIYIANVGDYVSLGNYQNKSLTWKVINKNENKVELLLNEVLLVDSFHDADEWYDSKIRRFLNCDFVRNAFNYEVQNLIGGDFYKDNVRLLSKEELMAIFADQKEMYASLFNEKDEKRNLSWFLSPEDLSDISMVPVVSSDGEVVSVNKYTECGVRPVVQVMLPFVTP